MGLIRRGWPVLHGDKHSFLVAMLNVDVSFQPLSQTDIQIMR
jgi:hypothetical protein